MIDAAADLNADILCVIAGGVGNAAPSVREGAPTGAGWINESRRARRG